MTGWSVLVAATRTNNTLHDNLPISIGPIDDRLGVAQGQVTVTIPITPGVQDRVEDALLSYRRIWWFLRDEQPRFAAVVGAQDQFTEQSGAVTAVLKRADHLWTRRLIASTLVFQQVDQLDIARNIMGYALGFTPLAVAADRLPDITPLPHANLPWMRLDDSWSGVLRDRLDDDAGYQGPKGMPVSDALTNLTQLQNGFEYRLDYGRDADGTCWCQPTLGYPTVGRPDPIPIEYPGSAPGFTVAEDSWDAENYSRDVGSGSGVQRLVGAWAADWEALNMPGNPDSAWPLLMGQGTSTASEQTTLDDAGRARLATYWREHIGWAFRLDSRMLGYYDLGDTLAPVVAHRRWGYPQAQPLRLPAQRITGHRIEPGGPGRPETLTPILTGA
jgi:hypothetical protein